jgi:hypothetical protein
VTGPVLSTRLVANFGFDVGPRPINRADRHLLTPDKYQTYQIAAPHQTHYRPATCEEVDCERYLNGWRVDVQALSEQQRHAIITSCYQFTQVDEVDDAGVQLIFWEFAAGQRCFQASNHQLPSGRPALFLVRQGDYRASKVIHQYRDPESWRDDFAEHQDKWATIAQRG